MVPAGLALLPREERSANERKKKPIQNPTYIARAIDTAFA